MTIDDILAVINIIGFLLAFAFIPFAPLIMWVLADKFGILDDDI